MGEDDEKDKSDIKKLESEGKHWTGLDQTSFAFPHWFSKPVNPLIWVACREEPVPQTSFKLFPRFIPPMQVSPQLLYIMDAPHILCIAYVILLLLCITDHLFS